MTNLQLFYFIIPIFILFLVVFLLFQYINNIKKKINGYKELAMKYSIIIAENKELHTRIRIYNLFESLPKNSNENNKHTITTLHNLKTEYEVDPKGNDYLVGMMLRLKHFMDIADNTKGNIDNQRVKTYSKEISKQQFYGGHSSKNS